MDRLLEDRLPIAERELPEDRVAELRDDDERDVELFEPDERVGGVLIAEDRPDRDEDELRPDDADELLRVLGFRT